MKDFDKVWTHGRITVLNKNNEIEVLENSFLAIKNKKIVKIDKMENLSKFTSKESLMLKTD